MCQYHNQYNQLLVIMIRFGLCLKTSCYVNLASTQVVCAIPRSTERLLLIRSTAKNQQNYQTVARENQHQSSHQSKVLKHYTNFLSVDYAATQIYWENLLNRWNAYELKECMKGAELGGRLQFPNLQAYLCMYMYYVL